MKDKSNNALVLWGSKADQFTALTDLGGEFQHTSYSTITPSETSKKQGAITRTVSSIVTALGLDHLLQQSAEGEGYEKMGTFVLTA